MGGDWNLLPQEIAEYDLTRASGGRVIRSAREGVWSRGRFFLAGPAVLADCVEAAQFEETLLPTYDAVQLTLRGLVRLPRVAAVLKPKSRPGQGRSERPCAKSSARAGQQASSVSSATQVPILHARPRRHWPTYPDAGPKLAPTPGRRFGSGIARHMGSVH